MSLLAKLHRNPLHKVAENEAYMARYRTEGLTLLDHYRHLTQLLPIYEALERKLANPAFSPALPDELSFALNRSAQIRKDLEYLKPFVPNEHTDEILKVTRAYVDEINEMDPTTETGRSQIFSHFLVRILGDLFGGQHLKSYALEAYKRHPGGRVYQERQPHPGTEHYHFRNGALKDFTAWLNRLEFGDGVEDSLASLADAAFQRHIDLFKELESTRPVSAAFTAARVQTSVARNSAGFFSCNTLAKAAAAGVAGLAIGAMIVTATYRLG